MQEMAAFCYTVSGENNKLRQFSFNEVILRDCRPWSMSCRFPDVSPKAEFDILKGPLSLISEFNCESGPLRMPNAAFGETSGNLQPMDHGLLARRMISLNNQDSRGSLKYCTAAFILFFSKLCHAHLVLFDSNQFKSLKVSSKEVSSLERT